VLQTSASLGGGRGVRSLAMQIETGQELIDVPRSAFRTAYVSSSADRGVEA
jgi:hypothetical protein